MTTLIGYPIHAEKIYIAMTNEIFRKRREYDCSCCRQFVKQIGSAVVIKNNKLETIWDLGIHDDKFEPVAKAMSDFVRRHCVTDVYVSKFKKVGTEYNYEQYESWSKDRRNLQKLGSGFFKEY